MGWIMYMMWMLMLIDWWGWGGGFMHVPHTPRCALLTNCIHSRIHIHSHVLSSGKVRAPHAPFQPFTPPHNLAPPPHPHFRRLSPHRLPEPPPPRICQVHLHPLRCVALNNIANRVRQWCRWLRHLRPPRVQALPVPSAPVALGGGCGGASSGKLCVGRPVRPAAAAV